MDRDLELYPRNAEALRDLSSAVEKHLLPGLLPSAPFLTKTTPIRTQGSCFARNLNAALRAEGYASKCMEFPEAVNSPAANEAFFNHALDPKRAYDTPEHESLFSRDTCASAREHLRSEALFVLSLGVAPLMYRRNGVVPTFVADPRSIQDYEMRHTSVTDNERSMRAIVAALRKINPAIKIVFTVSPVPLNRTFGLGSAVRADAISKSTLCVAAANVMADAPNEVYYWPSYEIVRWLAPHTSPAFGVDDGNLRHVNQSLVDLIVKLFLKYYAV